MTPIMKELFDALRHDADQMPAESLLCWPDKEVQFESLIEKWEKKNGIPVSAWGTNFNGSIIAEAVIPISNEINIVVATDAKAPMLIANPIVRAQLASETQAAIIASDHEVAFDYVLSDPEKAKAILKKLGMTFTPKVESAFGAHTMIIERHEMTDL